LPILLLQIPCISVISSLFVCAWEIVLHPWLCSSLAVLVILATRKSRGKEQGTVLYCIDPHVRLDHNNLLRGNHSKKDEAQTTIIGRLLNDNQSAS
jgi:hypothetical protein